MRNDFNEVTNLRIINQLKENYQNHKFCFRTNPDHITSDLTFIKKFVSRIYKLEVNADGLNSNQMEKIKYTLSSSNIKVSIQLKCI